MSAPFTPDQEARLREIAREEMARASAEHGRLLARLADPKRAAPLTPVGEQEPSTREIVFTPLAAGRPRKVKGVRGLTYEEFKASQRSEASPQAHGRDSTRHIAGAP